MNDLEKRLHNLEVAFVAYISLTNDLLPPEYKESVDKMASEYFDASRDCGAFRDQAFK